MSAFRTLPGANIEKRIGAAGVGDALTCHLV